MIAVTEFLLARIDDDEEWAQAVYFSARRAGRTLDMNYRVRVLAECKAKRAIVEVEILRYCDNVPRSGFISLDVADRIRGRADTPILRALAAVYADHPDYQPEWKIAA